MYATIGVRDGGSGGGSPPPIRAVCRHQFGQRVDIIRAKQKFTCFPRSLLRYVSGRVTKETFIGYYSTTVKNRLCNSSLLAGHPRSGCPARLRGHKGSGLWKVWTVPSPPLPCPALPYPTPSPPLPSLPSPPLPSLPSLPPSRVPNLIKLGPAVWPKLQPAEARECSAALAISEWTRRLSAMLIIARRKMLF